MASEVEVEVEVEARAPEDILFQKQDGTIGSTKEDIQGKNDLEASIGNNDNTNGECFLYPPSVEKVVWEDKARVSEDCPKAGEHDQVQTTILGSSDQHNEIQKSETADEVQEENVGKTNLDVEEGMEATKELFQSEKKEHRDDNKEKSSSIETVTSPIVTDQVLISKTINYEKEVDVKVEDESNSAFEENLENETGDEEKNSQGHAVNEDNTTEADGKEITGSLDSELSQKENDSPPGIDSVEKEDEIQEPSSKIETIEDKEEKMALMEERAHEEQAFGVTESRDLTTSEGNAHEEATVKDIKLSTEVEEEKYAEPFKFDPEKRQEGNNSKELMETNMKTKAPESDLQKYEAGSDAKELKEDAPAEISINQQTGAEPIEQSLPGTNSGVNESIQDDNRKPCTQENSENRDFPIEKEVNECTLSEEHTHQKNDMKDSAATESVDDAYEMEFSNLNKNMAEDSVIEEVAEDVKDETEQKAFPEEDDFYMTRISKDNTTEADVKGIADGLEGDPSKEENNSSLGNDSTKEKDGNQEPSSKIEAAEEDKQGRVVSSGERNHNEQEAEVSDSSELTPSLANADEEAAVKDINLATEVVEDKCPEHLESEPEKRQEGNHSEELIETNIDTKASENALQKSGAASDGKEEVNEDVPAEVNLTQQTGAETVQQSLPVSNQEVNESIHDEDKDDCTAKISDDFPIEKEGDKSTLDEPHEKNDVQDSAAKDLADASNEEELTDIKQGTVKNVAQDNTIKEAAEGVKNETEELSPGKIEDLKRSTLPETTAPEQSTENVSIVKNLGSTIQESEVSPIDDTAELTSSPVAEKTGDTPGELQVKQKSSNRSAEIDEQVDQMPLSYDAQGSQNLDVCNEEENKSLPTESSEMNIDALKEEPNCKPIKIAKNGTVNITEEAVDVTDQQNRNEHNNLKRPASEETEAIDEEKPDLTPNPTKEDSVAGLTDEGLTQSHQTIEERTEHVEATLAQPAKEDDACDSHSPGTAKEDATTASSVEDVAAEEIVQSNEELCTPCTEAEEKEITSEKEAHHVENSSQSDFPEGNLPEVSTAEVKHTPGDEGHKGASHISHDPSTEQDPEPVDAVKELDSESVSLCDDRLISADKSQDVEEQGVQPTEHMASERNYEDQALRAPEGDNDLDVEGSINEAEDADHEATEVDHKETQAVKQEVTEEDVQHVEKGTVDELEKSDTKDEDSSQQHNEKNSTESDIAEIKEDKEEAHECSRPNEIHGPDTVKDEEIVNCELEERNTGNYTGNEEAIEASQGNGENTSISSDEVQLHGVQEEATIDKLEDAEDDDSNKCAERREFTPSVANADEEAAVKDIDLATEVVEDKCPEPLASEPKKGQEGNNSEEFMENRWKMKASESVLQKSGAASEEKEELNEDAPTEVDTTQQTMAETSQRSLPVSNPEVHESIRNDDKIRDDFPLEKEDAAQNMAEDNAVEETAEGAKDRTEDLSPEKIEKLERSTSLETMATEQSTETLDPIMQKSAVSAIENAAELTTYPVAEKTDDTPGELNVEENSSNRSTEIDGPIDETPLSYDAEGKSSQKLHMCDEEENEALPTVSLEKNTEAVKEAPNQSPIEISENGTVNITVAVDVTDQENTDEQLNLKRQASEETEAINDEKPDVTPNPTEEDSIARLTDEGLTQSHQPIEERTEHAEAKLARPAKEDDACNSQSLETAKEDATTASSVKDVAAKEIVQINKDLNTPYTEAEEKETTLEKEAHRVENSSQSDHSEGNSPEISTAELKHIPTDQGHEVASHISHDPFTEQNPEPVDAAKEPDSESAAPCDNSPISADKSQEVEEQDAQPTENMASERNYEDQALRAPEGDNDLDVEGSINEAKDTDHEAIEVDHKETQAFKQEATEEGVQHVEKGTVGELEKSDTMDEDSSQQHDEKNSSESDIAEIKEDKEGHECRRSNEIHGADPVKDEEIVNCELEERNTGISIGNEEATEASQGNDGNTTISKDEVQLAGVQEETTIDKLEDAEDDDPNKRAESREFTPSAADADEVAVKDIHLATEVAEDKCEEPLASEPKKGQEGNNSEELMETNQEMKASEIVLERSGAASDENEELNEDALTEVDTTQQTMAATSQPSLPVSNPEVNESIRNDDREYCTEEIRDDFPIEKEGDQSTLSEKHIHEKNNVKDSATTNLADTSDELKLTTIQVDAARNMAEDNAVEETAEGAKDKTEDLPPEKIEKLERSTSLETIATEQSTETLDPIMQKSGVSAIENAAELTTYPVAEKTYDTPGELNAEENSSNRSTEIDGPVDQTPLSYDAEGKSSQKLDKCDEEENEALPTESLEMNTEAVKEAPNQNPIEISENRTVNITVAVDVTDQENTDEQLNLERQASEETDAINDEKPDGTPNPNKESSVAELTEEGLTPSHQIIGKSAEDVEAEQAQPANEDNVCGSKTLDIAEEEATRPSSGEDVAEKEIAPSNMELNTPCLSTEQRENILEKEADHVESFSQSDSSEGHSPAMTATEVKHTPSDRQQKGVIHINPGPATEQIPQPIDAVEELDSESVAPSNDSLISANKSKDVEEQAAKPTEHMVSERNDEDISLSVPEEDNDLDVEGSKAEDADHEATDVDRKETQAVKQEATQEDVQHVAERGIVDELEESNTKDEDSSQQHDEKKITESKVAEIQGDEEEAHECSRSNEIHVVDTVKDEAVVNCELEESNTGDSVGNEEAIEASQGNGKNTSISGDEVQLAGVQEETTIDKLENAEYNDSNNTTGDISAEENVVPVVVVEKPELVTEPATTDDDCTTSDEANKYVAECSISALGCKNDKFDEHIPQEEHSNNEDSRVAETETELKNRELQLYEDTERMRKEAHHNDMQELAQNEEKLEATEVDIPQQHDQNSVAEVDNIEVKEHGKAHNQIESEEILGNDGVRHEESVDQRFEENIFSNEEAVQESIEASPSHKENTNTSREGDQVFEAQDEAAIKEQPKNLEDGTPIIDSISADENPEPVDAVEKLDSKSTAACDNGLSSETEEIRDVKDRDAKSTEHLPMEGHNDNQAPSITTVNNELDDECSRNKSEDADQEKIADPQVDPQKLDESTTTESETIEDRKDVGERQTSIYPKTCGTDTVNYEEIMNIDSNSNSAMGNEETAEASPSQDENASNSKNEIQVMEVQDEVKIDAESDKIEDGNSSNRVRDVSIEENPKPAEDVELLKCSTKSALADNDSVTSDEAKTSAEHEIQEEENANQGLGVIEVDDQLEDEESMSKEEDANQCALMAQEAKELKVNKEAQSITKEATEEISQKIADNEEKFADANADCEQNEKESTTEIDDSEVYKNVRTHEESGSEVIHVKETRDEESVDKRIEEINSHNQTANQESSEGSPSQNDCIMVYDDGNQIADVQEQTTVGKPNQKIEDEEISKITDNVSAEENPEVAEAAEKLEWCKNSDAAAGGTVTSDKADKSATEESNEVVEYPVAPSAEQLLQEGHSKNEDFLDIEGNANQDPEPVTCKDSQTSSEADKSGTEETQHVEEQHAKLHEYLPTKGHTDNQGVSVTKVDSEVNNEGSTKKSEELDQEATKGEPVEGTPNMKQEATADSSQNETLGQIEDEEREEVHNSNESNETHETETVKDKDTGNQDRNSDNAIGNEETVEAYPSQDENANTFNNANQGIGDRVEAKNDEQQEKIQDETSSNIVEGVPIDKSPKPAEDAEKLQCATKSTADSGDSIISDEANRSAEHVIQENQNANQGLGVTGLDNQLDDEESMSKGEEANQCFSMVHEEKDLELNEETQSITKETTDADLQQVADDELGIASEHNRKAADYQHAQPDELLLQGGRKEDEGSENIGSDANQVARELEIFTETASVRDGAAEDGFQQVKDHEEKIINGNVESPQQPHESNIVEIEKTELQRDENAHEQSEGSEIHGKDDELDEGILISKFEEPNNEEQNQEYDEASTPDTVAESPVPIKDKCNIDNEGIQVTDVQEEATTKSQDHSTQNDNASEENLEKPECGTEPTKLPEANTTEGATISRDVNDLEISYTENLTRSGCIEAESLGTEGKESDLAKDAAKKEEDADKPAEESQISKEPGDIDNLESIKEDLQQNITEELQNERNTSAVDHAQVHEDGKTKETCKSGEMDVSDFDKEKEIITDGFEPDNSNNDVPDHQPSMGVEASGQTAGEKDALSEDECPGISSGQAVVAETTKATVRDRECQTCESEGPESIHTISAEEVKHVGTSISEKKTEPVEDEVQDDLNKQDASVSAMTVGKHTPLDESESSRHLLVPELSSPEETIKDGDKQGVDSIEVKLNITNMTNAERTGSLEEHPEGSILKTLHGSSAEETQKVGGNDEKCVPSENEQLGNLATGETKKEHEFGAVASTEEIVNQFIEKQGLDDTQLQSMGDSSINCEAAEAMITEEDQLRQPSLEPHEMENEETSTAEDKEEGIMDVQILTEDKSLEKVTQEAESEPKVPISDFEPSEVSQIKQELVEQAGKTDESPITKPGDLSSQSHGANAPSESVTKRDVDSCSQRIINENEVTLPNMPEQTADVSLPNDSPTDDQQQSSSSEQVLKLHGQELTKSEETENREHHNAVLSELNPEENQGKMNSEANDATTSDATREENLGLADPLEKLEGSSEIAVASEKITEGEVEMAENEEDNPEMAGQKAESAENQNGEETILSINVKETNSNECSMDKTEEVDQVIEGPNISKKSDGCERDIIKEELQQATTGEQAENEEKCMTTDVDVPKQTAESNTSELENIEVQKDFMGLQWEEDSSGVKKKNQQSSPGDEESKLQIGAEQNTQNQDKQADISSDRIEAVEVDNMTAIERQHLPPLNSVSEEEVKYMYETTPTDKTETTSTEARDGNTSNAKDIREEQAPMEEIGKTEKVLTQELVPEENPKEEEKQMVACDDNMSNNITLIKEEPSSEETLLLDNVEKDLDISSTAKIEHADDRKQFSPDVEELVAQAKEIGSIPQPECESRDVVSAEDNANQLAVMQHVDDTEGAVMTPNETDSKTAYRDVEELTAADIIANQISQALEEEERRQQQSSEQLKKENTSNNELLKEEDKNYTCLEETTKQMHLPEETERVFEIQKDLQPKLVTEEKLERIDDVEMPESEDLPSVFQGTDSTLKDDTDKVSESSTEILNVKEIKDSNNLVSPRVNTVSQLINEENHAKLCTATIDDNKQSASLEKVPEIHGEGRIRSEEIDLEKHQKATSSGLLSDEKCVLTSEAHQTTMSDAATEEAVDQKAIHDNQGSPEETTARSPEADENQTMIKRTKVLDEKVQHSQQTTELYDRAEETTAEDDEGRTMQSSTSLLSGQKEAAVCGKVSYLDIPKTQTSIFVPKTPEATEERKAKTLADDPDIPTEPKHPENAMTVTDDLILEKHEINTYKVPCQSIKENQQPTPKGIQEDRVKAQDSTDKESLEMRLMQNMTKLENTDAPCKLVGDKIDVSLNTTHPQDTTEGASEEVTQIGSHPSQVTSTTDSKRNKAVALQQQEPLKVLQIEEADESSTSSHMIESKSRSMPMDSGIIAAQTCRSGKHMVEKGEQTIPKEETLDGKEAMAEKQKTDEEKDGSIDHSYEYLEREMPITAEAIKEMELKATQKKSHNILSGVGSKVKHSISKMKKAIACSSAQFSHEDVIIKVNKNKKA